MNVNVNLNKTNTMSSNLIVQLVSLVLWVFALAGLQIDPGKVGTDAVTAISTQNWSLFLIVIFNVGNSVWQWAQTWKNNKPNFILFLKSYNWWVSALNIGFAVIAMQGITLPEGASEKIVEFAMNGEWWAMAGYMLPNIVAPIVRALTAKKTVAA